MSAFLGEAIRCSEAAPPGFRWGVWNLDYDSAGQPVAIVRLLFLGAAIAATARATLPDLVVADERPGVFHRAQQVAVAAALARMWAT